MPATSTRTVSNNSDQIKDLEMLGSFSLPEDATKQTLTAPLDPRHREASLKRRHPMGRRQTRAAVKKPIAALRIPTERRLMNICVQKPPILSYAFWCGPSMPSRGGLSKSEKGHREWYVSEEI